MISRDWKIPNTPYLEKVKQNWFSDSHKLYTNDQAKPILNEWFQSTSANNLQGWSSLGCVDVTMGCAHFIESFISKYGLDGFQILNQEYAFYSFMGKWGTEVGNLEPNKPLIITLPHYKWADLRPEWNDVLVECEQKNIDIHIDMAWLTLSRNIEIDFAHPRIQSVGMSMSKFNLQWNRVGLRYSKQRTLDSVTIFNFFYKQQTNANLASCAVYCAENISRDYFWENYKRKHQEICKEYNLQETKLIHGARDGDTVYCITDLLTT